MTNIKLEFLLMTLILGNLYATKLKYYYQKPAFVLRIYDLKSKMMNEPTLLTRKGLYILAFCD
jgi:hypothetical protein